MKKILLGAAALLASVLPVHAAETAYNQALVNQVVTTTTSYTLDLTAYGIDSISFQATVSSASPPTDTFTDGHVSSGTITILSTTAIVAAGSSDTIKVTTNTALSPTAGSDSMLITSSASAWSGLQYSSFTIVTASSVTFKIGLDISTSGVLATTSSGTAVLVANAINLKSENVLATVSGSSVIVTCSANGLFCNSYLMNSSTNTFTVANANFKGGNNNATFTLGAVPGGGTFIFTQGQQWSQQGTSSDTAISIMNGINTVPAYFSASTPTTTSVLIQLVNKGLAGNATTLVVSTGALTVGTANFIGGQENATFCIAGTCFLQGTGFTAGASSATAANAISAAINASTALNTLIASTAPLACGLSSPCGVVYATGAIITSGNFNYVMYSSTNAISLSSTTLLAGTTAAYSLNSPIINIPNHGLATGLEVKFSTGSALAIGGLTNQTSYYAIVLDANNVELSLTSTGAVAGTFITLTSSSTTGAHNFTLTPLILAGNTALTWSVSNDGVNFSTPTVTAQNVTIPVNALATPWAAITYGYDFGPIAYKYLRLTASGPSPAGNGGINTVVTGYGKKITGR